MMEVVMATARRPTGEAKSTSGTTGAGYAARTVLFNDEIHTFEEVANQLVKAIRWLRTRPTTVARRTAACSSC